jgi:hypothetical protein
MNEEGLWQTILRNKHLKNQTIGKVVRKSGDSHFWSGLMKVKEDFLRFASFKLNNGTQIRFWEDKWISNTSFWDKYPSLYDIVRRKSDIVPSVLSTIPLNVSFERSWNETNRRRWYELVLSIVHIQLNNDVDQIRWNLHQNGQFTIHSMYLAVINNGVVERNWDIWQLRVPFKIKKIHVVPA